MSCAIMVYGPIGSGKTRTCLKLAERVRAEGISVGGILSIRAYQNGDLIGYDGLDIGSGEVFPLARLKRMVEGPDWFVFSHLIYAFSTQGFVRANHVLSLSAERLSSHSIILVDEFGRLERAGLGIYRGAAKVADSLKGGGVAIFTCRTDMVGAAEELIRGRAQLVFRQEPGDTEELWNILRGYI